MKRARRHLRWMVAFTALSLPAAGSSAHGDLHVQIRALSLQIQRDPGNAALFHKRGELERAHGQRDAALRDYERAARLDPTLSAVHFSRGRMLVESGQLSAGLAALDLYLAREPRHAQAHLLRARALSALARHAEAEGAFARALAASADPMPDLFLERAENLRAAGDAVAALAVLEAGLSRIGSVVTLEQKALHLELALSHFDAALARVDRWLALAGRRESALHERAMVLDHAGRREAAQAARAEALAAIAALPPRQRALASTRELERSLRAEQREATAP